jgi:hypothetical protein
MSKDLAKELNKSKRESKFWKNKPMMEGNMFSSNSSKIDNLNDRFLYNGQKSHILPEILDWKITESSDDASLSIVSKFLNLYYKEKNNMILTADFLKTILGKEGFILSIVTKNNNSLCGVVCVSIKKMQVFDKNQKFVHANFLCAHPKFRKKGIAEVMINELIRYVNIEKKIQQGLFVSDKKISNPCTVIRRYYRPINYCKLAESNFLKLDGKDNVIHNKFSLPTSENPSNYKLMTDEHIDKVYQLYNEYMCQFNVSIFYTKQELKELLIDNNFIKSYVIVNDSNDVIDFVSYYTIEYQTESKDVINVGQVFLYSLLKEYGESMMNNLIKIMNNDNIDIVFVNDDKNMINVLLTEKYCENEDSDSDTYERVFEHKFLKEDKKNVYLFNWECCQVSSNKVNLDFIF